MNLNVITLTNFIVCCLIIKEEMIIIFVGHDNEEKEE